MNRTTDGDELITYGEDGFHEDGSRFQAGSIDAIRFGSGTKGAANTSFHRIFAWCALAIILVSVLATLKIALGY